MVPITIRIEEVDEDKVLTGRELSKSYEWHLVPRTDDIIGVGGNSYPVHEVIHYLDRNPATIEVIVQWPTFDFEMLSEDPSWEKVFWDI